MTPTEAQEWFNNTRELTKRKEHRQTLDTVLRITNFLGDAASLPQRLWHIIHQTENIPGCKMCESQVAWDRRYKRYKTYCSNPKCPNTDPEILQAKTTKTNYAAAVSKRQATNQAKYGHTNYLATEQGKTKAIISKKRVYGDDYATQEREKREATMLARYGVRNIFNLKHNFSETKHIKYGSACNVHKRRQTLQRQHGVNNPMQIKYKEVYDKTSNPDWLVEQHLLHKKSFQLLSYELSGIDPTALLNTVRTKYPDFVPSRYDVSVGHKQLTELLDSMGVSYLINDRSIIAPKELDIYLPDHKIAIEYCGLYWHSEQQGKDRQYHRKKYLACQEQGIQLLTIFEDEWIQRRHQVERKLQHLLGLCTDKIAARKTKCVELDTKTKDAFFEAHHIQGTGPGSITYGLEHGGQIVAAMTFIQQSNCAYTLNRYATSTRVVGGFSKLLNHFKLNTEWKELISFADLRWSDGGLYIKTGWTLDKVLPPDYYYSPDGHSRIHKFNYRRRNLPERLVSFDPSLSEVENCKNNGILRIWDCGKNRYVQHAD